MLTKKQLEKYNKVLVQLFEMYNCSEGFSYTRMTKDILIPSFLLTFGNQYTVRQVNDEDYCDLYHAIGSFDIINKDSYTRVSVQVERSNSPITIHQEVYDIEVYPTTQEIIDDFLNIFGKGFGKITKVEVDNFHDRMNIDAVAELLFTKTFAKFPEINRIQIDIQRK